MDRRRSGPAAGEPGRETDTGRIKVGDGTTAWSALPCAVDPAAAAAAVPAVPALSWKVVDGMLCVSPNTPPDNPILSDCYVGILRYKNPRCHRRPDGTSRPSVKGYKLIQDVNTQPEEVSWTQVRINPVKIDVPTLVAGDGWLPLISVSDLAGRFIEQVPNVRFAGGKELILHRGRNVAGNTFGPGYDGLIRQKATVYCGVVLFRYGPKKSIRYEGPRSLFRVSVANYAGTYLRP